MSLERELEFLSTFVHGKISAKATKAELVKRIREKYLFTDDARMTNVKKTVFKHASLFIRYDYLRQLTSFIPEKTSNAHLLSLKVSPSTLFHFTHSGQGAILQSLGFLKLQGFRTYHSKTNLYWETEQTLDLLSYKPSETPEIFWIDSSSFDVHSSWSVPPSTKWVVVDTTCWFIEGEEFKLLREKLSQHDVIAVRSHVKLDMHGVEYAPLGSITLSSKRLDLHSIPFYEAARLFGTTASPESIPPYLLDSASIKLALRRKNTFRKSHDLVKELASIASDDVTIQCPPHGLYFYLAFRKNSLELPEIQKKALIVAEEAEIDLRHLESFGFDFFGLQVFKPRRAQEFEKCLRISYGASGITKSKLKKLLDGLVAVRS